MSGIPRFSLLTGSGLDRPCIKFNRLLLGGKAIEKVCIVNKARIQIAGPGSTVGPQFLEPPGAFALSALHSTIRATKRMGQRLSPCPRTPALLAPAPITAFESFKGVVGALGGSWVFHSRAPELLRCVLPDRSEVLPERGALLQLQRCLAAGRSPCHRSALLQTCAEVVCNIKRKEKPLLLNIKGEGQAMPWQGKTCPQWPQGAS